MLDRGEGVWEWDGDGDKEPPMEGLVDIDPLRELEAHPVLPTAGAGLLGVGERDTRGLREALSVALGVDEKESIGEDVSTNPTPEVSRALYTHHCGSCCCCCCCC